jgi:spermidine synthase
MIDGVRVLRTADGFRLVEHGVVLSEVRRQIGATHSVFDVLAALASLFCSSDRLGLLGFAGGGMVAPMRCLGVESRIETCDLDGRGYELFKKHCPTLADGVEWSARDAQSWLRTKANVFDLLIDDLSVSHEGDVFKPDCSWETLPSLMKSRLRHGGVVVANQLKPQNASWKNSLLVFEKLFREIQVIHLDDFENRIVIAGQRLPDVRTTSRAVRERLRRMGSRQSRKISVRRCSGD